MKLSQIRAAEIVRHVSASVAAGLCVALLTFSVLSAFTPPAPEPMAPALAAAGSAVELPPALPPTPVDDAAAEAFYAPEPAVVAAIESPSATPPTATDRVVEGEISRGDSLASAMGRLGVGPEVVHLIASEMRGHFDFRRAQPGHSFRLTQDPVGAPVAFRYRTSDLESWELRREGEAYVVHRDRIALAARPARIGGVVSSTLYKAITDLGGDPQLAADFADVFAWDIDFSRSVQVGDEFKILYEALYRIEGDGNEIYVRPGRILAARYTGGVGTRTALYFEPQEGRGGYYRPDGSAVEREFLMAPLRYSRISSSYSTARRHPILKVTRPHYGIDYAASSGTPLWSVADGDVIARGWAGGFGNLVKIRHANGYVSYYAHLSRFAKGLKVGQRVHQKQLIGYVGSSGLATGPHVCFRVTKDGKYVNPARVARPAAKPVPTDVQHLFYTARDGLLAELDSGPVLATEEAL